MSCRWPGFVGLVIARLAVIKIIGAVTAGQADVVDGRILPTEQEVWAGGRS